MLDVVLTERLRLRRPTVADIDVIHRILSDPAACAHNPADLLTTRAEAEALFRRWDEHWHQHGFGYFVVQTRATDPEADALGFCGIKLMRLHGREVLNLLYRLAPSAWGNGVATEAAAAVLGWAAGHAPDHPVVARIRPANVASQRVAQHIGLRRAENLDTDGEDGLDWIFVSHWPDARP